MYRPTVTVGVRMRLHGERDSLGNDVGGHGPRVDVGGALVAPGACSDLDASRPEGVRVAFTVHFPKTFSGDLRGALVILPPPCDGGNPYRVIGSPMPYPPAACRGPWGMTAEVEMVDG